MAAHHTVLSDLFIFIGRILFSFIFIAAGIYKIVYFGMVLAQVQHLGIPYAEWLLIVALVFELLGGLLILLGWYARFGALLLFLFIIPATYYFHSFWALTGPEAMAQLQHALKNLALLGGTLYIMAFGAGRLSFDGIFRKKKS